MTGAEIMAMRWLAKNRRFGPAIANSSVSWLAQEVETVLELPRFPTIHLYCLAQHL